MLIVYGWDIRASFVEADMGMHSVPRVPNPAPFAVFLLRVDFFAPFPLCVLSVIITDATTTQ